MKVAITGVGLVCPAGIGLAAARARLAEGPVSPERPAGPEGDAFPAPPIFTVPPFDARPFLRRRKDRKLMARANLLAVVAGRLAVDDAGLGDDLAAGGLFLGVGREPGSLDDILPVVAHSHRGGRVDLDALVDEGMRWMNPLSSLKTLPNMSLAHVAITLGITGPGYALCDGAAAGWEAVREAAVAVATGQAPWALAGGADARAGFTDRLTALRQGQTGPVGEGAALFVLEPLEAAQARGARIHGLMPAGAPTHRPFGDCGAATEALALALSLGTKPAAPALHIRRRSTPIAITGVGAVTPLGDSLADFGPRLLAGESAVAPIRRFDATRFPVRNACEANSPTLPASLAVEMEGIDDRKGELALAAGLAAARDHGAPLDGAGLIYATGLSSVSFEELDQDTVPFIDAAGDFDYPRFAAAAAPMRPQSPWRHLVSRPADLLAAHLGLSGPRAQHFSACAAGAAAIAHAADLIRRGEAEVMVAGGADSMVHPFGLLPFILLGATSTEVDPRRAGRPFAPDRDGFVMGEGAALFVLEPLERARAAGRRVHGLVLGAGSSCDAWNVTAPHPEGRGAEAAMRAALADAGLPPAAVDYVNAHGTGTPLNDVIEAGAIARVFGPHRPAVSSSKAQFGHTIAAAGAVEMLACLAAFAGGRLPPNAHLEAVDPDVDLDLVSRAGRAEAPGIILSNSFGFGGQNACLVLGHPDRGLEA